MAFISTRMALYLKSILLSCFQAMVLSPATAEQLVSSWGPWSACSSKCKGDQKRTRQCINQAPSEKCEVDLEQARECGQPSWSAGCFSLAMTIALAVICVAILLAVIIIIVLCRRKRKEKERLEHKSEDISSIIEKRYDDSVSMNSSARRVPSVGSFPEPLKEPEMIDLDNFAFDQESLNESIHEMAFTFGTDEEYQPNAQNKHEDRKMSLKVVSVTETQVIDREEGLPVAEKPSPTYATVMKPKAKAKEDIVDVTL